MFFKDVIGQESLKQHLIDSVEKGIIPHSQMFYGQDGTGAFQIAFAYARYLNCINRHHDDSCGLCPSCIKYNELAHPDLHFVFPMITSAKPKKESCDDYMSEWREFLKKQFSDNVYFNLESWLKCIDAENKQATIYSRESDFIIRKMNLRVYEADYRVLFIWLPEKMHTACANKLLKIIEEPYPNTSIIMVSENPDQVLGTIMSRSQLIRIKPLETDLLTQTLKQKWGLDENAARQIAHLSAGNYLRATEQLSLETDSAYFLEQFKTIMRNGWSRNIVGMRSFAEEMSSHSRDKQKNFLDFCQRQIRENFIYSLDEPQMNYLNKKESDFAVNFSKFVNERNIVDMMEELELADRHISQNVNSKMVFFDLSMRIIVLIKK